MILHKDVGAGLGFSIAGGCDLENKAPTVRRTQKTSLTDNFVRTQIAIISVCGVLPTIEGGVTVITYIRFSISPYHN